MNPLRLWIKVMVLFVVMNLAYAAINPHIGRISLYNSVAPGLTRLAVPAPGIEQLPILDLGMLVQAHVLASTPKAAEEYRVFVLGDSQTWGGALGYKQTLVGQLNQMGLKACGKDMHFYNLAFPGPSALKDFLFLKRTWVHQPDAVVWMLTPLSLFPDDRALALVGDERHWALETLREHGLAEYAYLIGSEPSSWERLPVYQASRLRNWLILQATAIVWMAGGSDAPVDPQNAIATQLRAAPSLLTIEDDASGFFYSGRQPSQHRNLLRILPAMRGILDDSPLLAVVEPMYMYRKATSETHYNFVYPRWAFDAFLPNLEEAVLRRGWSYLDLHDLIDPADFNDRVFHLTAAGEEKLAAALVPELMGLPCR